MPGAYVPPHLRNRTQGASPATNTASSASSDGFTLEEIHDHFWSTSNTTEAEQGRFSSSGALSRTLHDSKHTPGRLAFSNLELLPHGKPEDHATGNVEKLKEEAGGEGAPLAISGESKDTGTPIAIFKQANTSQSTARFVFGGGYRIGLIDFLEPKSPELVRMLEQKWTKRKGGRTFQEERSSESWQRSLALRWAVVKLVRDESAEREKGAPAIERRAPSPREERSVKEMLAELRVRDETNRSPTKGLKDVNAREATQAHTEGEEHQAQ